MACSVRRSWVGLPTVAKLSGVVLSVVDDVPVDSENACGVTSSISMVRQPVVFGDASRVRFVHKCLQGRDACVVSVFVVLCSSKKNIF
jgi:hypothetical protein